MGGDHFCHDETTGRMYLRGEPVLDSEREVRDYGMWLSGVRYALLDRLVTESGDLMVTDSADALIRQAAGEPVIDASTSAFLATVRRDGINTD